MNLDRRRDEREMKKERRKEGGEQEKESEGIRSRSVESRGLHANPEGRTRVNMLSQD